MCAHRRWPTVTDGEIGAKLARRPGLRAGMDGKRPSPGQPERISPKVRASVTSGTRNPGPADQEVLTHALAPLPPHPPAISPSFAAASAGQGSTCRPVVTRTGPRRCAGKSDRVHGRQLLPGRSGKRRPSAGHHTWRIPGDHRNLSRLGILEGTLKSLDVRTLTSLSLPFRLTATAR